MEKRESVPWKRVPPPEKDPRVDQLIELALQEDLGERGDITTQVMVPHGATADAEIHCGEPAVICGIFLIDRILRKLDPACRVVPAVRDGERVEAGQTVVRMRADARALLSTERTLLNFLQHLSGIATQTRRLVTTVPEKGPLIVDTRKTLPGMRSLQKWAVSCGGGWNHRLRLDEGVLIKDNHKIIWKETTGRGLADAVREVRRLYPGAWGEVAIESMAELLDALEARPDVVMLDNMPPEKISDCVRLCPPEILVEVSGGITAQNLSGYFLKGVNAISLGMLTSSVKAVDLSLAVIKGSVRRKEGQET
ncbi:MAG: carboxylating nicotinate-nucleotide diphosphorylase [Verrucomicrobia bacterium]|nr:MAG: carboxylating nicotinate-nucleotide diphosphorylase [Verrucomicrobiota bacterium]